MNKWIEPVAGLALVAAWLVVVWTADAGLREQDRDALEKANATQQAEPAAPRTATATPAPRS